MRALFGVLSLLLVVAVVGFLAKKQLSSVNDIKVPAAESTGVGVNVPAISVSPSANGQQQSQQIQQQFKAAADAAMQQARPMPDDK